MPDKTVSRGVGLYRDEWTELEKISKEHNATLHAIAVYAIRYFLKQYHAGKIKLQKEQRLGKP